MSQAKRPAGQVMEVGGKSNVPRIFLDVFGISIILDDSVCETKECEMKRLGVVVTAFGLMIVSNTALAEETLGFEPTVEFRVRYLSIMNGTGTDASGQAAETTGRFKLNIRARKGERLEAFATLLHNSVFGSGQTSTGAYDQEVASNTVLVNRAWALWKASPELVLRAGRLEIEFGDGAVFSENEWEDYPTAHEGIHASWDMAFANLSLYAIKTHEYPPIPGNSDPERNYYLASADMKNAPRFLQRMNVHLVHVVKDETTAAPSSADPVGGEQNFSHLGFTLGGERGLFSYKLTGAYQYGKYGRAVLSTDPARDIRASMLDAMVGYSIPEALGLMVQGSVHRDSGDDGSVDSTERYQTFYYDRHHYSGLMDVIGWGNLTYWNVKASIWPDEDLEVGTSYYMFRRTSNADLNTAIGSQYRGLTASAITVAEGDGDLGSEIDLFASKVIENDFKLSAHFGIFILGRYFKDGEVNRNKALMEAEVQAAIRF